MNRLEFSKQIIQTVDNCRDIDSMSDDELAHVIFSLLAPLKPNDKERFASWGQPNQQTTPDKCW